MSITNYPDADFTPNIPNSIANTGKQSYNPTGSFRFWAQKVLPTVYDDSLSYYEILTKVVNYLNNVIQNVDSLNDSVDNTNAAFDTLQTYVNTTKNTLIGAYNELQSYVNTYFDSLDVQDEINTKLDALATDGTLTNLISPLLPNLIANWLSTHITPTTPAIDNTLSVSGAGADAKVAGDRVNELNERLNALATQNIYSGKIRELTDFTKTENNAWRINDTPVPGTEYYYNRYSIADLNILFVSGRSWGDKYPLISFYDSNDNLLGTEGETSQEYTDRIVYVPNNSSYCYVNGATYSTNTVTVSTYDNETIFDILISSETKYVDVCRTNTVLMDLNNAEPNSVYRLYFRYNEQLVVDNLPFTKSYSTLGTLFTFGEQSETMAFRAQVLITDSDGIYFRYGTSIGYDEWHTILDMRRVNYVTISDSDDVIQKLIEANRTNYITDIYFNDGNYDIIELYKRHYGPNFFDTYTGYDSGSNYYGRGLILAHGKHYHFSDQALFHAEYTGNNTNVTTYFSMFAPEYGSGCIVDGLHITSCNNLRYAVHADFSTGSYNGGCVEFRNCYFNTSDRCIGAGLLNGSVLKLVDSIFMQSSDIVPVHVHSPNTQDDTGKLIVNGCYFSNRLQFGKGGSNTAKSTALITNTSLVNLVNENNTWDVISFNIERRTQ